MRRVSLFLLPLLLLGGCMQEAQHTDTPAADEVTIENISVENYFETGINRESFTHVPQRIVVIGANESETLLDLGVTEGIVSATPSQNNPTYGIKACNQAAFDTLPQMRRAEINTERLLALRPDLIVAQQEFFSKNRLGSTAYWNERGTATMVPVQYDRAWEAQPTRDDCTRDEVRPRSGYDLSQGTGGGTDHRRHLRAD